MAACDRTVQAEREWTPADHGQPAQAVEDDGRAAPAADTEATAGGPARAAAALWNVSCAGCHGRGGHGDGPSPPPGATMPDFSRPEFQEARSDAELVAAVHEGRGLMPSFSDKLSERAILALVAHIRSLAVAPAASPATGPDAK